MNFASKRKRDELEPDTKKTKNFINEKERQECAASNEWPIYNHPEGGTVKITPWGSLRQYTASNGETVTKFEDINFQDYAFNNCKSLNNIYEFLPSTPQSLYQQNSSSSSPERIRLSPSDEAEYYVINGYQYQKMTPPPSNDSRSANRSTISQFEQEHENYFGMEEQEEFECDGSIDTTNQNDDEMMM